MSRMAAAYVAAPASSMSSSGGKTAIRTHNPERGGASSGPPSTVDSSSTWAGTDGVDQRSMMTLPVGRRTHVGVSPSATIVDRPSAFTPVMTRRANLGFGSDDIHAPSGLGLGLGLALGRRRDAP